MLEVANKENVDADWLRNEIALGKIVIPKNKTTIFLFVELEKD